MLKSENFLSKAILSLATGIMFSKLYCDGPIPQTRNHAQCTRVQTS